jgi:hypothetical protein
MFLIPLNFREKVFKISPTVLVSNDVRGHHSTHHTVTMSKDLASYVQPDRVVA